MGFRGGVKLTPPPAGIGLIRGGGGLPFKEFKPMFLSFNLCCTLSSENKLFGFGSNKFNEISSTLEKIIPVPTEIKLRKLIFDFY